MMEDNFPVPDVRLELELYPSTRAVQRHYMVIRDAMRTGDKRTVGDRQLRLLKAGKEIPVTLQQCNKLLEQYTNDA